VKFLKFALAAALASTLAGCGLSPSITRNEKQMGDLVGQAQEQGKADSRGSGVAPFMVNSGSYVNAVPVTFDDGREMLKDKKILLKEGGVYLADIGDRVTRLTGIQVRFSPDLAKRRDLVATTMGLKYSGPLAGLLDQVCSYYNVNWEYDVKTSTILVYYQKTRVFSLPAFIDDMELDTAISNKADSTQANSGQGGTTVSTNSNAGEQTVKTKGKYEPWAEIVDNVKRMVSKDGSVVAAKGSGTITVTDSPVVLGEVARYVESVSNKMARQVFLNVKAYNFTSTDELDVGASLNVMFRNAANAANALYSFAGGNTPTTQASTSSSVMAAILTGANSMWAGSTAMANALKTFGRMSLFTTASGLTMNNQPLPVQSLQRQSYLASASTSMNTSQSQTSLVPGQVVTGVSIIIVPHIEPDDTVDLECNISLSTLDSMQTITSGGVSIQTPNVSSRAMSQRFRVKTGSTVVVAGLASDQNGENNSLGLGTAAIGHTRDKEYFVIMIDIADATLSSLGS
jgi:type IVB pilus formation R64 PilN family outer membrane protein